MQQTINWRPGGAQGAELPILGARFLVVESNGMAFIDSYEAMNRLWSQIQWWLPADELGPNGEGE